MTGDAAVDDAHRRLGALYDRIRATVEAEVADDEGLDALCGELLALARAHFVEEEALMAATAFPDLASHRKQHQGFLRQIEDMRAFVRATGDGDGDGSGTTGYVGRYLALAVVGQWLKVHTGVADRRFADHLALTAAVRRTG